MRWKKVSSSVTLPAPGFILPCIPTAMKRAPRGVDWIFEIKHDGYRLLIRKREGDVRIYSRRGMDLTRRYPRIVEGARRLKVSSALLDGEGIVYDSQGMPNFDLMHARQHDHAVSLVAFDLLELDGDDVRQRSLAERKKRLAKLLARSVEGIEYNEHLTGDGAEIFAHVCRLGHEGIVAKRADLPYESGRSKRWLKIKNPDSPAMQRVRDETF